MLIARTCLLIGRSPLTGNCDDALSGCEFSTAGPGIHEMVAAKKRNR